MTNRAMPSLAKVGFTTNTPDQRARELEGTGIPHRFTVEYAALVIDPQWVEGRAHEQLEEHHEGKEWFRCEVEHAVIAIRTSADRVLREDYRRVDRQLIAQEQLRRRREADQRAARDKRQQDIAEQANSEMRRMRDESHRTRLDIAKIEEDKIARGRAAALKAWDQSASSAWYVLPFTLPIAVLAPINLGLGILYAVVVFVCFIVSIPIRKGRALSAYEASEEVLKIRAQAKVWRERETAKLESRLTQIETKRAFLTAEASQK